MKIFSMLSKEHSAHQDDSATETATKKSDDKSAKKTTTGSLPGGKDPNAKSATGKEPRPGN